MAGLVGKGGGGVVGCTRRFGKCRSISNVTIVAELILDVNSLAI